MNHLRQDLRNDSSASSSCWNHDAVQVSFCGLIAADSPVPSSHPHWTGTLTWGSLSSLAVVLVVYVSKRRRRRQRPERSAAFSRKQDFIQRAGDNYGYQDSPHCGHIDTWRLKELPQLIPPLHQESKNNSHMMEEPEVYLVRSLPGRHASFRMPPFSNQ